MTGEQLVRRLTAIFAADVAGYSRLTGIDEEGTHVRLKEHLRILIDPKVAVHRGHIVKNTGDGFLVESESQRTFFLDVDGSIIQRQFHELLSRTGFDKDPTTQSAHTLYSLRHTAICMRIILSEGQVNIFNLAKNAGTSVDQIERFYARKLPLSKEMARNLQSFGSG